MQVTNNRRKMRSVLIGMCLLVSASALWAQDSARDTKLVDEIWQARAKGEYETVESKIEELKKADPKNSAIAVNAEWAKKMRENGGKMPSSFEKPANYTPKTQPTPVPTPRPTPVPKPIAYDPTQDSFVAKVMSYLDKGKKWFLDQEIYVQGGLGVLVLAVFGGLGVFIMRRRKAGEEEVVTPVSLTSGGMGLSPLGGGLASSPIAPPSFDPLGDDVDLPEVSEPVSAVPEAAPASSKEVHPASANAQHPPAGSMTDSTVNLIRSFGNNMDSFSKDPNTDLPGQDDPNSEFNLEALFGGEKKEPEPVSATPSVDGIDVSKSTMDLLSAFGENMEEVKKEPLPPGSSLEDLTTLFEGEQKAPVPEETAPKKDAAFADLTALFDQEPQATPAPVVAPKPATKAMPDLMALFSQEPEAAPTPVASSKSAASSMPDLTALFAEDPLGMSDSRPAVSAADDGGDAFYNDQMSKARTAIQEGRFSDAVNFLSIVTALNPTDAEAAKLFAEAKSKM